MNSYFKCVNELADWLGDIEGKRTTSYVRTDQVRQAKKLLAEGDPKFLLSFIKGIRCWVGVFRITGKQLRESTNNSPWGKYYFDVEPIHILDTPEKCFLGRESKMRTGHQGRGVYNHIWKHPERIHKQIEKVSALSKSDAKAEATADVVFDGFKCSWDEARKRSASSGRLVIKQSEGQCPICGVTKHEWIDRILLKASKWRKAFDINRIRDNHFELLHVHHREPVKAGGTAELDNLTAICPNCHDLLTRAGKAGARPKVERHS
jgi:5-methylcytosine-specific restriction endonuclease McrA